MRRPRSRFRLPAPSVERLEHHDSHVAAAARSAREGRLDGAAVPHVHQGAPGTGELKGQSGADGAHIAGAEVVDALDPAGLQAGVDAQDIAHGEGVRGIGDEAAVEVEPRSVESAHAGGTEVAQLEAREPIETPAVEPRQADTQLAELPKVKRL